MDKLSKEEQFIVETIKKNGEDGKSIIYKKLQDFCANEFEGVRLILKKMKEKGILEYEGIIPGITNKIQLK
jgi:hypothetical protein